MILLAKSLRGFCPRVELGDKWVGSQLQADFANNIIK